MQTETCQLCAKTIAGADVLYTADARIACRDCYDKADVAAASLGSSSGATGLATAGAVAGVIPFLVHVSSSSTVMVNGEVVSATSRDYIALVCGVVAIILGALTAVGAVRSKQGGAALAMRIGVVALGAYQIARGLGVI